MSIEVTSESFESGGAIPARFTCDGDDTSPPLAWSGAPEGTESYALVADDPDAPGRTFVHWVFYGIPAETTSLPAGVPASERPELGGAQGRNGFRNIGYGGPCPPRGTHRYFFKIYALDTTLSLDPGATKADLLEATKGHVLAQGELMGTYER
jgi:hypothetical protein